LKISWKNKEIVRLAVKNKHLKKFIFESGSLTRLLQKKCTGRFDISLINESWCKALPDEMRVLSLRNNENSFVRESYLSCNNEKLVYARTIIPRKTLDRKNQKLTRLGHSPLGEVLFKNKKAHRKNIKYGKISLQDISHSKITLDEKIPYSLFARQSIFYINSKPLLVIEIFLPALMGT